MATPPTPPVFDNNNQNNKATSLPPIPAADRDTSTRIVDPSAAYENPDSSTRIISDQNRPVVKSRSKKPLIIGILAIMVLTGLGIGAYFLFFNNSSDDNLEKRFDYDDTADNIEEVAIPEDSVTAGSNGYEESQASETATTQSGARGWRDGINRIQGIFISESGSLEFRLTLNYSTGTGRVSDVSVQPAGASSPVNLDLATVSGDGSVIIVSGILDGEKFKLQATSAKNNGVFKGSMSCRGMNGVCDLTLN